MGGAVVINETMLRDIRSQPGALAQGLSSMRDAAATIDFGAPERIVMTGSGDSLIAPLALQSLFQRSCAAPVVAVPSLDASRYGSIGPGDLLIAISVSGKVARTLEAAERARIAGAMVLSITAEASSPLADTGHGVLVMPSPIDRTIPHSRDYMCTLLALAIALERLTGARLERLDALPTDVETITSRALDLVPSFPLAKGRTWFLGAGADRATAMYGALKYWEAGGMQSWWDDLEEFAHGSQLMAVPGDRAVLIAAGPGEQRAHEMIHGLERMGLSPYLVGGSGMAYDRLPHLPTIEDIEPRWHPLYSCIPLQILTWHEAEARGIDVKVPLFGHAHGAVFDEVHVEWTKRSAVTVPAASNAPLREQTKGEGSDGR